MNFGQTVQSLFRSLDALAEYVRDWYEDRVFPGRRKAVEATRKIVAQSIQENFDTSTDPDGHPWQPIYHRTGRPLVDTTNLQRAAVQAVLGAATDETGLYAQLVHPYGVFHEFGTRKIIARPFFGIGPEDEQQAADEGLTSVFEYEVPRH